MRRSASISCTRRSMRNKLIDTADTYSRTRRVGGLQERPLPAIATRSSASKVRLRAEGWPEQGAFAAMDHASVRGEPKRLRTDHIDLTETHRPDLDTDLERRSTADRSVRASKIRYFGCSMFPAWYQAQAHSISAQRGLSARVRDAVFDPSRSIERRPARRVHFVATMMAVQTDGFTGVPSEFAIGAVL